MRTQRDFIRYMMLIFDSATWDFPTLMWYAEQMAHNTGVEEVLVCSVKDCVRAAIRLTYKKYNREPLTKNTRNLQKCLSKQGKQSAD